jgi:hypothetical protein
MSSTMVMLETMEKYVAFADRCETEINAIVDEIDDDATTQARLQFLERALVARIKQQSNARRTANLLAISIGATEINRLESLVPY